MKKTLIALSVATLGFAATAQAAVEASAVATWQATAKKDTTSELVVTPLSSLSFQYAEGIKGFNTVNGLFDVAIKGDASATDFTLKAKKLNGTLNHLGGDSTVDVGRRTGQHNRLHHPDRHRCRHHGGESFSSCQRLQERCRTRHSAGFLHFQH